MQVFAWDPPPTVGRLCLSTGSDKRWTHGASRHLCPSHGQAGSNPKVRLADQPVQCAISIDSHPLSDANPVDRRKWFHRLAPDKRVARFRTFSCNLSPECGQIARQECGTNPRGSQSAFRSLRADSAIFARGNRRLDPELWRIGASVNKHFTQSCAARDCD